MGKKQKRSKFEESVADILEPLGFLYEQTRIPYTIKHNYTPDFSLGHFHVECKGWFRPGDQQRYMAVDKAYKARGEQFIFLFQNGSKKCRSSGKMTMSEWADKYDILWFDDPEQLAWYVLGSNMVVP